MNCTTKINMCYFPQKYLTSLNIRLDELEGVSNNIDNFSSTPAENDLVEEYLSVLFEENVAKTSHQEEKTILSEIVQLESRTKIAVSTQDFNVIQYWIKKRYTDPKLFRLAKILLSVPSTQVTVERLFSQLKFVITDNRMKLKDETVKNVMFLKMNSQLLEEIVEKMFESDNKAIL